MKKTRKLLQLINIPIFADRVTVIIFLVDLTISILCFFYVFLRYKYLNPYIPLWYTRIWGDSQLAPAKFIFVIPIISATIVILTFIVVNSLYKNRNKEALFTTELFSLITTSFLFLSVMKIIDKAASPFPPLINQNITALFPLIIGSFGLCAVVVPWVIKFAKKYDIVTDPTIHTHPGMILKKPSARVGAVAFYIAFLAFSLVFIPITRVSIGLYVGALLTTLIGIADDKKSLNPYLRLLVLLPIAIIVTLVISNLHIFYFANPVDGTMRLDFIQLPLTLFGMKFVFIPISDIFTVIWILWVMNMLSWSNAVDGQYSGMVAITCFITALLSLRLLKIDPNQIYTARLAAIAAGASLGLLPYNWHPSKIMWGFGATTMGLVISVLSVMAGTKVAVATLVLIVPTLDAAITMLRRILQKKSPVWGDRGHLHHRLLDMGFTPQQVAVFYWIVTAVIGSVALISSGRSKFLALLTIGGLVAFTLVTVNLKGELGKPKPLEPEK